MPKQQCWMQPEQHKAFFWGAPSKYLRDASVWGAAKTYHARFNTQKTLLDTNTNPKLWTCKCMRFDIISFYCKCMRFNQKGPVWVSHLCVISCCCTTNQVKSQNAEIPEWIRTYKLSKMQKCRKKLKIERCNWMRFNQKSTVWVSHLLSFC